MGLIKMCFGDYYTTISPALFTDDNTKANGPTPDLLALKGARIAVANEMRDNATINAANFKRYSGKDELVARDLNKTNEKFEVQCRIFCTMNNYIPFSENTHAVYRRLKLIPFESKFVKQD
jgi:phage/plasmid-associated DNA primase